MKIQNPDTTETKNRPPDLDVTMWPYVNPRPIHGTEDYTSVYFAVRDLNEYLNQVDEFPTVLAEVLFIQRISALTIIYLSPILFGNIHELDDSDGLDKWTEARETIQQATATLSIANKIVHAAGVNPMHLPSNLLASPLNDHQEDPTSH